MPVSRANAAGCRVRCMVSQLNVLRDCCQMPVCRHIKLRTLDPQRGIPSMIALLPTEMQKSFLHDSTSRIEDDATDADLHCSRMARLKDTRLLALLATISESSNSLAFLLPQMAAFKQNMLGSEPSHLVEEAAGFELCG